MNRYFLVVLCLLVGCAKVAQQTPRTHDPPVTVEKQVDKPVEQKSGDIDQVVKSLTFEREEYLSKLEKQRIKSTKDLVGNPKAQELVDELHQVETLLDVAKKEQWRQKFIQERRDREARQMARSQAVQKVVELPLLPEDGIIRSLEKEEIAKSAIQNTEEWGRKFDSEMKQREELRNKAEKDAEAYRSQLRRDLEKVKLQAEAEEAKLLADIKESKLRAAAAKLRAEAQRQSTAWESNIPQKNSVTTKDQWSEWWKNYTKAHAKHSCDCTVYCCRHNDTFWSHCPSALQQMFPREQVISSNGAYKVVPKNKLTVYCSATFWGLIPNTYHGAWCPYHPRTQQVAQK